MRKPSLSLRRLLLEQDYSAYDAYLKGEFVINPEDDPEDAGDAGASPPVKGMAIPPPPIPASLSPMLNNFEERYTAAKSWFEKNKARGAELSAGLLNAESGTLEGFKTLAAEATQLDGTDGPPFHQFAATCLVTTPGGYAYANEIANAAFAMTEIFFLKGATLGKLSVSDKIWIALPGVLEGIEAAIRNRVPENITSENIPLIGTSLPAPAETAPAPAPGAVQESRYARSRQKRYSLLRALFESAGDDAIKAAVREVLGSEIADFGGTLIEKVFKALLLKPELDKGSALESILQKIKTVADRRGVLIENNEQLKNFITQNADAIFDESTMSEYVETLRRDIKATAVQRAAEALARSTGESTENLITGVFNDLEKFYKQMDPAGSVTPFDKKIAADALADLYATPGFANLTLDQQNVLIANTFNQRWREPIDLAIDGLENLKAAATTAGSNEFLIRQYAILADGEIIEIVSRGLRASGITGISVEKLTFEIADSSSGVIRSGLYRGTIVEEIAPEAIEGFEGVTTYVARVVCQDSKGGTFTVSVNDFLESLKKQTGGLTLKSVAANNTFSKILDERLQRLYGELDAELSQNSASGWAQIMNKTIDDSATDNLLRKPVSDISRAANIERDVSGVVSGLKKMGHSIRTAWKDLRQWHKNIMSAQGEITKLSPEEALALAARKRSVAIGLWAMLYDLLDEPIENYFYIMYVSGPDVEAQYRAFGAARSSQPQMDAAAKRAIEIASALVEKFSTPSLVGGDAPMKTASETVIIAAADAWTKVGQNVKDYADLIGQINAQKAQAAVLPESLRRLRAVIRESILLDTIRRIRR
jgi:hypothetical protein